MAENYSEKHPPTRRSVINYFEISAETEPAPPFPSPARGLGPGLLGSAARIRAAAPWAVQFSTKLVITVTKKYKSIFRTYMKARARLFRRFATTGGENYEATVYSPSRVCAPLQQSGRG